MKFAPFRRILALAMVILATGQGLAASPEKFVRLRNERIATTKPATSSLQSSKSAPVSGLFLIQFEATPTPGQRSQLTALGADLLSYIPDDAFVASLSNATPGLLQSLPFVRWVGPFKPEHKLDARLTSGAQQKSGSTADLEVSVLLSPRANARDASAARATLGRITSQSEFRQGSIVRGILSASRLQQLAASPVVLWIEPAPHMQLNDEIATKIVAGDDGATGTPATVHQLGYTGIGATVAVADSGLDSGDTNAMHPDLAGRVAGLFYYGALEDAADEHSHGTHCAGIVAGNAATGEVDENGYRYGLGVAPGANVVGQRIFDGVGNYTLTDSFEKLTRDAKSAGADIASNSWGEDTQGRYDLSAMEFDALVRDAVSDFYLTGDQPYIIEFSAGNAGPGTRTVGSPAVAKNVIATGACQNSRPDLLVYGDGPDAMADFSSRGPCEDGRIKPDITAPGTWIASLRSVYADDNNAWGPISDHYLYQGGTSQAGPHVSGAAAIFVQFWRASQAGATPSPALVKAALINSATDMDETAIGSTSVDENGDPIDIGFPVDANPVPNMDEGWGRVDLENLIGTPRQYEFIDQSVLLTHQQEFEQRVLVGSADEPLRITLTYTDVPGSPMTIPALVNDLDLEVIGPDGRIFHGNQFNAGESIPDAASFDTLNNVESVYLSGPVPGEYRVRVRARNVVMDARRDTGEVDQDFALVISGEFAASGTGLLAFDRQVYSAPATMTLRLVDHDLAGQATASIALSSTTEATPESITLHAEGTTGLFTGRVATATGTMIADGKLQVQHGDAITAMYQDAQPVAQRIFTAQADLLPPIISNVYVTNRFARSQIHWNTDEPAASRVLYGTNSALGLVKTNTTFNTEHDVTLDNQVPGQTYYFRIVCTDEAGNLSTNDNGDLPYQFTAPFAPSILLVDAFHNDAFFDDVPLSGYTDPLDELGLPYAVWDTSVDGSPTLAELQPFRVVIWRLPEVGVGQPTLTTDEQAALTQYLTGGGGLFIASMEAVSRLDSYGGMDFRQNVLHIASYVADVGVSGVEEVPGNPIGNGVSFETDFTPYLGGFDFSDTLTPDAGAEGILTDFDTGGFTGISYPRVGVDSPGRVVYLAFPFDTIPTSGSYPGNRATVLRRILMFLAPGLNGEGSIVFNQSAYAVPSQATVAVADSDLEGIGQITIHLASDTQPTGLSLNLQETLRRGVFQGTVLLLSTNPSGALPGLVVTPGDTMKADYFDASLNATVSAYANVETNPPVIGDISVEPGYLDAVVYWSTDELADSLVEFGPSQLLGRTAFDHTPTDDHGIELAQLEANRTYYYRVVSRDAAGNVAVDDNDGKLHTFTTLEPLHPPWWDNLENAGTNWTVYTVDESERGWDLGEPGFLSPPAHSPSKAWGSNLSGDYASQIESYLISPAILLSGGNHATLNFWQAYDLTAPSESDIIHAGELLLITNNALEPISLGVYTDDAVDWEPIEVDLTPYTGQVVYLAWHYFLFSLDSLPRTGWLVDDISVSITNIEPGTVTVSNNLWQAGFLIEGAATFTGTGRSASFTNATPGTYTIRYSDVPFYQKPPPQTNQLAPAGTLVFTGNYTFADSNSNSIPDSWEQARFGSISPTRNAETDTDHDGMTDLAEAIAGTNPNDPLPPFRLTSITASNGLLRLDWAAVPNVQYRVQNATYLNDWTVLSPWIAATGTNTSYTTPLTGDARLFRVEATNTTGMPASLMLTASQQPDGALRFDWAAAGGRAYRVIGGSNLANWTAVSDWLRTNTFTLPANTISTPWFFRLEVAP